MRIVSQHEVATENAEDLADSEAKRIDRFLGIADKREGALWSVSQYSILEFSYRSLVDPTVDLLVTWQSFVRAMQAGSGFFEVVTKKPEDEIELRIGKEVIRRPGRGRPMIQCRSDSASLEVGVVG